MLNVHIDIAVRHGKASKYVRYEIKSGILYGYTPRGEQTTIGRLDEITAGDYIGDLHETVNQLNWLLRRIGRNAKKA